MKITKVEKGNYLTKYTIEENGKSSQVIVDYMGIIRVENYTSNCTDRIEHMLKYGKLERFLQKLDICK